MFKTLQDEKKIHKEIFAFKTQAKQFCNYFIVWFYGKDLPQEMKSKNGFIIRGYAASSLF